MIRLADLRCLQVCGFKADKWGQDLAPRLSASDAGEVSDRDAAPGSRDG